MRYFLKQMKKYKLGDSDAIYNAMATIDLSNINKAIKKQVGKNTAIYLINTIDRIEYINIKSIPNKIKSDKWTYKTKEYLNKTLEISIIKLQDENWKFSKKTVSDIKDFYLSVKDLKVKSGVKELYDWRISLQNKLPKWTLKRSFILLNSQWIGLFIILLLSFMAMLLTKILYKKIFIYKFINKYFKIDKKTEKDLTYPLGLLAFSVIWISGIHQLGFAPSKILSLTHLLFNALFVFSIMLILYNLIDYLCIYLQKLAEKTESQFDDIFYSLLKKTLKVFIVMVGIVAVGDALSFNMKNILAGMGIGGLAFALASKDSISNLFGSLTIVFDRPFSIGDWVIIDNNIEGIVEEVGIRSCRIRTFYDSLITIPNGQLTNASIDNYGKRTHRRFRTSIAIQYDTPCEKIEDFCQKIRELIEHNPKIRKDNYHVYFNNMGDFSLDIILSVFFQAKDWGSELQERHNLLMSILKLGNEMGVEFAFPTQTIHLNQEKT